MVHHVKNGGFRMSKHFLDILQKKEKKELGKFKKPQLRGGAAPFCRLSSRVN